MSGGARERGNEQPSRSSQKAFDWKNNYNPILCFHIDLHHAPASLMNFPKGNSPEASDTATVRINESLTNVLLTQSAIQSTHTFFFPSFLPSLLACSLSLSPGLFLRSRFLLVPPPTQSRKKRTRQGFHSMWKRGTCPVFCRSEPVRCLRGARLQHQCWRRRRRDSAAAATPVPNYESHFFLFFRPLSFPKSGERFSCCGNDVCFPANFLHCYPTPLW